MTTSRNMDDGLDLRDLRLARSARRLCVSYGADEPEWVSDIMAQEKSILDGVPTLRERVALAGDVPIGEEPYNIYVNEVTLEYRIVGVSTMNQSIIKWCDNDGEMALRKMTRPYLDWLRSLWTGRTNDSACIRLQAAIKKYQPELIGGVPQQGEIRA